MYRIAKAIYKGSGDKSISIQLKEVFMVASSKRKRRVKKRKDMRKEDGTIKAKRKFDTIAENLDVMQDIGKRKRFSPEDLANIKPLNETQKRFIELYFQDIPIIMATGWPGTSKSFLSIYCALNEVFDNSSPYDKLIIVRSAVETRSVGYLKGSLEDKAEPFELPYKAIFSEIMPRFNDAYYHAKNLGYVDFMLTTHIRGINIKNSVILIEEAQNMDIDELRSVITRTGEESRILITGDVLQDDLKRKKEKSGLEQLKRILLRMPREYYACVEYSKNDIVRSGIVKEFVIADFEENNRVY